MRNAAALERSHDIDAPVARMVHIEEGLIGFSQLKNFVLLDNSGIVPFRLMESVEPPKVRFVVVDPAIVQPGYMDQIPTREWETMGLSDRTKRLVFVTVSIGANPKDATANLQAPILLNYETMTARQVILTNSGFQAKHPVL